MATDVRETMFILTLLISAHLCPAVVEGVVGLHTGEPLNAIKSAQCIHLPIVSGHLVSPAPSFQSLNLDPFIQGTVILPNFVLCVFTSWNNRIKRENVSAFTIRHRKGVKRKGSR